MQKYVRAHLLLINYLVCCVDAYYVNDLKLGKYELPNMGSKAPCAYLG